MGTSADFYKGMGEKAEYLGSIYYDGYPKGVNRKVRAAHRVADYESAVRNMLLDGRVAGIPGDVDQEVYAKPVKIEPRSRHKRSMLVPARGHVRMWRV